MNTKVVVLRSRIAQCLIAPMVVVCLFATPEPAHAQTTTALFLDSQPGDWVGAGIQQTVTPATHTFQVTRGFRQGVRVDLVGPAFSRWGLDFAATDNIPLQPGEYGGATRASFTRFNGIDVGGDGRGCNQTTGRFVVLEIVYGALGAVERLAIDFEQHCDDGAPGLYGAVRFNSTISTLVPFGGAYPSYVMRVSPGPNGVVTGAGFECRVNGPVCAVSFPAPTTATFTATPDPGYIFAGWSPPCHGAKTISVFVNTEKTCQAVFSPVTPLSPTTILWWNSEPGEPIGRGTREVYSAVNSRWGLQRFNGGNSVVLSIDSVHAKGNSWWRLLFKGPGQTQPLTPGTYTVVPWSDQFQTDLDVGGNGIGCNITEGHFVVHELDMTGGVVNRLAIDFEQHCGAGAIVPGALSGSIRFNSSLPPTATLALDMSGQGQVAMLPSGRICTGDCSQSFSPGTIVQLTPTSGAAHWTFPGWSGDADCADGVVTLDAPTLCAASFQAIVSADSVTPNAGAGTTQTFTFRYSSPAGATDLTTVRFRFGASNVGPGTCTVSYSFNTGTSLLNDAGTAWQNSIAFFGTLANSQCTLNLAGGSATRVGNVVTLMLNITFAPSFVGLKNIYMLATGATGSNTGWHHRGTWMPATDPTLAVVDAVSVSPSAGSGTTQAFTLQYSDSLGASDLSSARVRFGASNVGPGTCTVWYDATTATIKLMDDAAVWGAPVALGSGTLANSQCSVNLASSMATSTGNTLTLVLQLTFAGGFPGLKNIYMLAASATGPSSGWIQRGTWTPNAVVGPAVVNPVSVTPNSGSGATQAFTLQYTDSLGASDLSSARVRIGATNVGPGTCTVWYDAVANNIKLMDDAGAWGASVALGGGTLANSQCSLNLASSTATPNGTTLTLVLQITFAGGFTGLKNVYMFAGSATGPTSGWIQRGTWTPNVVVGPATVNAASVSPSSGSGATQAFTLQYTDSLGASDLSSARVRFGASNVGPGTCTVWYDAITATIKLMDDAGVWPAPVALGAGTLANSQCTINLASSTATPNGNTLTLVLHISFAGGFTGLKNIYMLAGSATGPTSGWIQRGTWTPSVIGPTVVDAVSVLPSFGGGGTQSFALEYSDASGAGNLSSARVRFGASNVGPATCTAWYDATNATIKLMDDAGAWGTPVALGSGTLANSQCTLNLAASVTAVNGNTLTLVLNIAFSGNFAGPKSVFMLAGNAGGASSGWVTRGTWTVPGALLRDDFNASSLDLTNWFMPSGAGTFLGRTQLRPPSESLEVANGVVRLRLDTYNPTALVPGDSFWGSEIVSNTVFERGNGLTFSARVRLVGPVPGGLVASLFSYMTQSGVRDEIDFELPSNNAAGPNFLTNVYDDDDFTAPGNPLFQSLPGFSMTEFNLYEIQWLPDRVRWRVNGVVVREDFVNVPDDPMSIRLNLWAPSSTFTQAYNAALQPVDDPAANQTFYYDVDFVEVRTTP